MRSFALGLAVAACLLAPAVATAQDDSRAKAQKLMAEGIQLLDQGQPADALNLFKEANGLAPNTRYQYNMGIALQALGRDAEALDAFQAFLARPEGVPPQYIGDARKHVDVLRTRIATVIVSSKQDGAGVQVNGREVGRTPLPRPLSLDPGEYRFVLRKEAFEPFERLESLARGQTLTLNVNLQPVAGPKVVTIEVPRDQPRETPIYQRWWFWTAAGAVVTSAVVTTLLLTSGSDGPTCAERTLCLNN